MRQVIKKCIRILDKKQKNKIIGMIFLMVIGAFLETFSISLIIPYVTMISTMENFTLLTILLIVAFVLKNLFVYWQKIIQNSFILNNCYKTTIRVFQTYLDKPYEYFLYNNSNKIITSVNVYVTKTYVLISVLLNLATTLIVNAMLLCFMLFVNAPMTLIVGIVMGSLVLFMKKFINPKMTAYGKASNDAYESMVTCVSQAINGIKEVKVFGSEDYFIKEYEKFGIQNTNLEKKKNQLGWIPSHVIEVVAVSTILLVLFFHSGFSGSNGTEMVAELAAFALMMFRFLPGTTKINNFINQVAYYKPSLMAIDEELEEYLKGAAHKTDTAEKISLKESIEVRDVTFSYDHTGERPVLNQANLTIKKGECVGIVGMSGAGKTTLVDLILGYLSPDKGIIYADGISIHENVPGWQKNIGYIPQMIFIMDGTIGDNVSFGRPLKTNQETEKRIWEVLKMARLDEFVASLPDGLQTKVGERGVRLSGGQRQRLGIARALFNNPDILIFDEATAALDNAMESEVMERIYALSKEKTVLMIAHRLSTLDRCDRIVEISEGKIL